MSANAADLRIITAGLEECEEVIERGLATFVEVGNALLRIRDQRLYRNEYRDFEVYCQTRWALSRSHAYRLIDAATVVGHLSPIGDMRESQVRELAPLKNDPEALVAVWETAKESAVGQPTATDLREARQRLYPAAPPIPPGAQPADSWPADDEDSSENEWPTVENEWPVDEWPDDETLTQEDCEALDRDLSDSELAREAEAVETVVKPLRMIPQPPKPAPLTEAERIARRKEQDHKDGLRRQVALMIAFLDSWHCASTLRISAWRDEILAELSAVDRARFLAIETQFPAIERPARNHA